MHSSTHPFALDTNPHSDWLLEAHALHIHPLRHHATAAHYTENEIWVLRDDLLHPWANGNKLRKLDAYLPHLKHQGVTDILTCGGVQSAHCAALSYLGAHFGIRTHLLLRGEQPKQVTGNLLVSQMFAHHITWVDRDTYSDRATMLETHTTRLHTWATDPHFKLASIPEGASDPLALKGLVRLVKNLKTQLPSPEQPWNLIVDSGTGTTMAGLIKGILNHKLPWHVTGVMLMQHQRETYTQTIEDLIQSTQQHNALPYTLVERTPPRRFGKILEKDIQKCRQIAQNTGIMVDPIYTLAAYEATLNAANTHTHNLWIHTGGALNLFGAVLRKPHALAP